MTKFLYWTQRSLVQRYNRHFSYLASATLHTQVHEIFRNFSDTESVDQRTVR